MFSLSTSAFVISLNSCTLLPQSSHCRRVLGRGSEYESPPQLPQEAAVILDMNLGSGFFTVNVLAQETQSPSACVELVLHMLCLLAKPPCNESTNLPMLLCPQTCLAYEKLISTGFCNNLVARIIKALEMTPFIWLREYLATFNCSDPASYFQNEPTADCGNSSSCTNLFSPEVEGIYNHVYMLHNNYAATQCKLFYSAAQILRDESFYRYILHNYVHSIRASKHVHM